MTYAMPYKLIKECRKASAYCEKECGYDNFDYLSQSAEELYDEKKCIQEADADSILCQTDEEILEDMLEFIWHETDNYIEFCKEQDEKERG